MTQERVGDWIQTWGGRPFWPLDPRPEEVYLEDIAHALGMVCRYGGHCDRFYSVAEHSFWVSSHLPDELKLWGLMHDASEAYLGDMVRPLKRCMPEYRTAELRVEQIIAERFGLSWPMPEEVKQVDTAMLLLERDQLMAPPPMAWYEDPDALRLEPFDLLCWDPFSACRAFLQQHAELTSTP